jgi:putative phosphoesterase
MSKILVISDVHGNLPALELLLKEEKNNFDQILSLGDVVNYGPWSNECVQLLNQLPNINCLMGNHEEYFIEGAYSNPGKVSELFFKETYKYFTEQSFIKEYQNHQTINNIYFTHTISDKYIFKDTILKVNQEYCIGHSHQQYINELNSFRIINPGSVGQNRAFINIISYAFYDTLKNVFNFKEIKYNVDVVINEMILKKYPLECINYYKNKNRL